MNTARYRTPDFDRADRLQAVIISLNRIIISPFSGELQSGKRCNNFLFFKEKQTHNLSYKLYLWGSLSSSLALSRAQCER